MIALLEENCTVCMLCARECPDWCIYIDSHKEEVQVPGAARPRQRNVLDRFAIDFSLCMYCGICIEACPFDALFWSPEFEYAEYDIRDLLHEKGTLREWMWTVPPPPAHDPQGEPAKEETARRARRWTHDDADVLLLALGALAIGAGIRVVATTHLVRAGLWLVVTLASLAGMYLVLGAELVAWVQVLLYVGAVVVLLLFAVMLTRAPIGSSPDMDRPRATGALIGGAAGLGLGALLVDAFHWTLRAAAARPATAENVGAAVFRTWALPFEVLSMLLLAALVGAIVVSRPVRGTE